MTQAKTVQQNAAAEDKSVRPFPINIPEEALVDLRRRIAATKWPERETVTDATQDVQLKTMRELAQKDYDWRKVEARLNAFAIHDDHRRCGHITTGSTKAGTLRPGNSRNCSLPSSERRSNDCAS